MSGGSGSVPIWAAVSIALIAAIGGPAGAVVAGHYASNDTKTQFENDQQAASIVLRRNAYVTYMSDIAAAAAAGPGKVDERKLETDLNLVLIVATSPAVGTRATELREGAIGEGGGAGTSRYRNAREAFLSAVRTELES